MYRSLSYKSCVIYYGRDRENLVKNTCKCVRIYRISLFIVATTTQASNVP